MFVDATPENHELCSKNEKEWHAHTIRPKSNSGTNHSQNLLNSTYIVPPAGLEPATNGL